MSETLRVRLEGLPKPVRDIARKREVRLCARYRRPARRARKLPVAVAAIAREMAPLLGGIARLAALCSRLARAARHRRDLAAALVMWPGHRPRLRWTADSEDHPPSAWGR